MTRTDSPDIPYFQCSEFRKKEDTDNNLDNYMSVLIKCLFFDII